MSKKTLSEKIFEEFCDENGIEFSPVIPNGQPSRKHPDYSITCSNQTVVVEIKELGQSPEDRTRLKRLKKTGRTGSFDPQLDKRVRKKIDRAMPQLRRLAKGTYATVVVLYDNESLIPLEVY